MKRRIMAGLIVLLLLIPTLSRAETVTRAVLLEVDSFAFRSQLSVAAENNVWRLAQVLSNANPAPSMILAFGKGGSEANSLMYSPKVNTPEALELLLDEAFGDAGEDEVLLLYICTHGVYTEDGENGLILSDGVSDVLLSGDRLAEMLSRYPNRIILILDACHSGALVGRGTGDLLGSNPFGENVSILASSGALEESWYWLSEENGSQGAFSFTEQMCIGLKAANGTPADGDGSGTVTLTELYQYLLQYHGASTPVLILGEGSEDFLSPIAGEQLPDPLRDIHFSADYCKNGEITLEMTAFRPISIAYRVALWDGNGWNLDAAMVLYDEGEDYSASLLAGSVSAGRKSRAFRFSNMKSDYVLLQVIINEEGKLSVPASHVIALLGEPCEVTAEAALGENGEIRLLLFHEKPALFTVTLKGEGFEKRVLVRRASRPSPANVSEYAFSSEGLHGKVSFQIEVSFAEEKITIDSNEILLP